MKRSMLYTGLGYVVAGLVCLAVALIWEPKISSLLFGLAGAGMIPGVMMIWKYGYWSSPKHREAYKARMREERILLHDERKIRLREKSGWLVYLLMLGIYCLLMLACALLIVLEVWMPFALYTIWLLLALLVFQWVAGIVIFRQLEKRM
jgi:hypothetical protein